MGTERPMRLCDVCGGLDDHPRHVTGLPAGAIEGTPSNDRLVELTDGRTIPVLALKELLNPTTIVRHMDCCAAQGCLICAETEQEYEARRGQELINHLEAVRSSNG